VRVSIAIVWCGNGEGHSTVMASDEVCAVCFGGDGTEDAAWSDATCRGGVGGGGCCRCDGGAVWSPRKGMRAGASLVLYA